MSAPLQPYAPQLDGQASAAYPQQTQPYQNYGPLPTYGNYPQMQDAVTPYSSQQQSVNLYMPQQQQHQQQQLATSNGMQSLPSQPLSNSTPATSKRPAGSQKKSSTAKKRKIAAEEGQSPGDDDYGTGQAMTAKERKAEKDKRAKTARACDS